MDTLATKMYLGKRLDGNMLQKLKQLFVKERTKKEILSLKDQATRAGRPYVEVVTLSFDPENPSKGFFELEWNKQFIQELQEAGYSGSTDEEIIDSWFTNLCRNIAEEV